jgi:hypothetical protein
MEFWILCLNLIKWVLEVLSPGVNQVECKVDRSLQPVLILRMSGAIHLLLLYTVMVWRGTALHLLSWCGDEKLYTYCHGVERDSFTLTVMVWRGTALHLLSWCG